MLKPIRARAVEPIRPTRAIVDLSALANNLEAIRELATGVVVFGVIKADAYGHGAIAVARRLEQEGVNGLCVALPEEGIELRQAGLRLPILILGGTYGWGVGETLAYGLTPVVHDLDQVALLHEAAGGRQVKVHLKVDTGMSRLGVGLNELPQLLWRMKKYTSVVIDGVMSHLAQADSDDDEPTLDQLGKFKRALSMVKQAGVTPTSIHLANSAGLYRFAETRFDLVRPGLALYGVPPIRGYGERLQPAMSVVTQIMHTRTLNRGERVSYGGTFVASRATRLGVLPVGYADGLSPQLANQGHVLVKGKRAPIVGAVCMDMCMIDITDVPGAAVGEEVVLLGKQGDESITVAELAKIHRSVPHEILTSVSRRVPRFYVR